MANPWNIAGDFIEGASLGARIAGIRGERQSAREKLAQEKLNEDAGSVEKTGYTPAQLVDASSGAQGTIQGRLSAAAAGKLALEDAQTKYYAGRNDTYLGVARARAAATAAGVAKGGLGDLQKQIKVYDQMSTIDPDGAKGIYTPEKALEHTALLNQFNLRQGISTPAPNMTPTPPKPSVMSRLSNWFAGGPAATSGAPAYTRFASGPSGRVGLNPSTNAWEPVGGQ